MIDFEVHGGVDGPSLELQLELLEPVPKVSSVALTVYCKQAREMEELQDRNSVAGLPKLSHQIFASTRPGGFVNVATWWQPLGVMALLNVLLAGRQIYVSFSAKQFYRNRTEVAGMGWYTKGAWLSDVVGEDSNLY